MSAPGFRLHSAKGRAVRSFLARRSQMLVELDGQGSADLALIRQTRELAPLLMRDAAALTILAWVRSALRLGGDLAEAGVFMGGSAHLICAAKGRVPLHLFDVFDTLQGNTSLDADEQAVRDYFDEVYAPLGKVRDLLAPYPEVHFHPGLFPGSAASLGDRRFAFVHLDFDRAEGTADALAFFYPRLLPGGVLIGDDYNLAPVRETFTDYFAGRSDGYAVLPWGQVVVVKSGG